jgi:hypothetical protein
MKQLIFLIALCLTLTVEAEAQRYLPGQKGIQFTVGAVDGFNLTHIAA